MRLMAECSIEYAIKAGLLVSYEKIPSHKCGESIDENAFQFYSFFKFILFSISFKLDSCFEKTNSYLFLHIQLLKTFLKNEKKSFYEVVMEKGIKSKLG